MTVGRLLATIDARELAEWSAYERVAGPLGPDRGDYQAAIIAATIANGNRDEKSEPFTPADFLPDWDQ
ncbi:phage tail assembly protein T [Actinomadura rupiterrae]|uniref:phage tail assembly protein T n=1 Tax=Actinomadura rupiterrae TaxID=559627 RepID=UPI0020A24169|nr:DUF4035 domain-containing protein [Actinomadura rupiterrae]MCP2339160.1 hypothetical protein [Actinomadura rupiterrae]